MSVRNGRDQAMATFCPAIAPSHVGLHPGFINENKLRGSQLRLLLAPFDASLGNILTCLLGGGDGLYKADQARPASYSSIWCLPKPCASPAARRATRRSSRRDGWSPAPESPVAGRSAWVPYGSAAAAPSFALSAYGVTEPLRRRIC